VPRGRRHDGGVSAHTGWLTPQHSFLAFHFFVVSGFSRTNDGPPKGGHYKEINARLEREANAELQCPWLTVAAVERREHKEVRQPLVGD
jgi:hypothetical protein